MSHSDKIVKIVIIIIIIIRRRRRRRTIIIIINKKKNFILYPCTKSLVKPGFYPGPSLVKNQGTLVLKPGLPDSNPMCKKVW